MQSICVWRMQLAEVRSSFAAQDSELQRHSLHACKFALPPHLTRSCGFCSEILEDGQHNEANTRSSPGQHMGGGRRGLLGQQEVGSGKDHLVPCMATSKEQAGIRAIATTISSYSWTRRHATIRLTLLEPCAEAQSPSPFTPNTTPRTPT